jgi:hypothetical protein
MSGDRSTRDSSALKSVGTEAETRLDAETVGVGEFANRWGLYLEENRFRIVD